MITKQFNNSLTHPAWIVRCKPCPTCKKSEVKSYQYDIPIHECEDCQMERGGFTNRIDWIVDFKTRGLVDD